MESFQFVTTSFLAPNAVQNVTHCMYNMLSYFERNQ